MLAFSPLSTAGIEEPMRSKIDRINVYFRELFQELSPNEPGPDGALEDDGTIPNAKFVLVEHHTKLKKARKLAAGTDIQIVDGGAKSNLTINYIGTPGDFSGPASSLTDNLVSFANTSGKVGKDSGILSTNVVTASAAIGDDRIVRGAGGAKGVQTSTFTLNDDGDLIPVGDGTQDLGSTSLALGDTYQKGVMYSNVADGAGTGFTLSHRVTQSADYELLSVGNVAHADPLLRLIDDVSLGSGLLKVVRSGVSAMAMTYNTIAFEADLSSAVDATGNVSFGVAGGDTLFVTPGTGKAVGSTVKNFIFRIDQANAAAAAYMHFQVGRNSTVGAHANDNYMRFFKGNNDLSVDNDVFQFDHPRAWVGTRRMMRLSAAGSDTVFVNQAGRWMPNGTHLSGFLAGGRWYTLDGAAGGAITVTDAGTTEPTT